MLCFILEKRTWELQEMMMKIFTWFFVRDYHESYSMHIFSFDTSSNCSHFSRKIFHIFRILIKYLIQKVYYIVKKDYIEVDRDIEHREKKRTSTSPGDWWRWPNSNERPRPNFSQSLIIFEYFQNITLQAGVRNDM